jgi:uncharacterized protein YndB with AHSA1/START domain
VTGSGIVVARASRAFAAPCERVFDAWLDPATIRRWFGPGLGPVTIAEVQARVGGRFAIVQRRGTEDVAHGGCFEELDRPRRLAFTWEVPPGSRERSRVLVALAPEGDGCRCDVAHEMDAQWREFVPRSAQAWAKMLEALAETLETPARPG